MPADDRLLIALAVLAGGLLLTWLFAWLARRLDDRTFVLARAPALPIRALAVGDDAWLRGRVRVLDGEPLVCPWFAAPCVAYRYTIEKKVTVTRRDKDGKTRTETEWRNEHSEDRAIAFALDDGAVVRVDVENAENEALQSLGTDYERSDRRHSAQVLELDAEVSVLGVVRDDRTFGCVREVPCLVTRKHRDERVRSSHRGETVLYCFALFFAFAGGAGAAAVWSQARDLPTWLQALACGLAPLLPVWWLLTHNRLIRLRQQVRTAFRQVDVDLGVRAGLVPNLVAVVRAAAAHERGLLESLTRLRAGADRDERIEADREAQRTARAVLLLHERYPDLKSDALYRDLHERLWAVEEKLAHTRSFYNDVVTEWNDRIASFPSLLVARACGHREATLFATDDGEALPPRLS